MDENRMHIGLMTLVSASRRQATNSHHPLRACLRLILVVLAAQCLLLAAKPQTWVELRSLNFIVVTNANEKQARHVAHQFEMVRAVLLKYFGISRSAVDQPVIIIAAKDEATLKALLPEYWAKPGSMHPAGFYLGSLEKNYVALRLDVSMNQSAFELYEPVYHEYVHYLTRRLMSQMPLWLVEGLAEFYGNIRIEGKTLYLGAPSASRLLVLRQNPPLGLSTLFDVNASSPYYHEENKASIFYAESWALTHYLIARDWREKTHRVNDFVALLGQNVPQTEAVRRTIGEPAVLEGALDQYIHNLAFSVDRLDAPEIDESDFRAQPISDAESLAVRADFMAHDRHYAEAQAMLDESLKLDPKLADAHESMGFLYFQQGKTEEAGKWYSEAVTLNPQSYSANFYYAANLLKGKLNNDSAAKAESSLRAALKINPDFAPAYSALAYLLAMASPTQKPDEAYMMVLQAIELEPGNVYYRIRAVQVLERLGRAEDAVRAANLAVSMARTPQEQAEASATMSSAQQFQAYQDRAEEFRKAQASAGPSSTAADQKQQTPLGKLTNPFGSSKSSSPSSAIAQAVQAAGAQEGDFGLGQGKQGKALGALDVLSDTMGVDFGPYLQRVLHDVKMNWYKLIPESARPPIMRKGKVAIEFAILRDGSIGGMKLSEGGSSGDSALDRAAWGGITTSGPFPPLPSEFAGQYLAVRFHFFYNPDRSDLQ
jgi:TonB family protein